MLIQEREQVRGRVQDQVRGQLQGEVQVLELAREQVVARSKYPRQVHSGLGHYDSVETTTISHSRTCSLQAYIPARNTICKGKTPRESTIGHPLRKRTMFHQVDGTPCCVC